MAKVEFKVPTWVEKRCHREDGAPEERVDAEAADEGDRA